MPTYEYECPSCGNIFEKFQKMSETALSECPKCGNKIRRVINGGSGIIFKGSGFYVNDSRKRGCSETCSASGSSGCSAKSSSGTGSIKTGKVTE